MRFTIDKEKCSVALVLLGLLLAPRLAAQQATIAGHVTDKTSQQPVAGAQVLLLGTSLGATTARDGQYKITNVPAGRYTTQVRFIGYATASQLVTLDPGASVTLDWTVTPAAVSLEAVVVTGTGAEQLKRELGNSIATIDAATIAEQAAPTNFADLLNARAPGVQVLPSGGTTGSGARLRIRGASSLSLSNEPIIVIDGIRVENGAASNSIGVGGQSPSRINDINPDEIESLEIVKGPSAASLYGTDAANGVIQIHTKRGRPGPTRWTTFTEGGSVSEVTAWPANYAAEDSTGGLCLLVDQAATACRIATLRSLNPLEQFSPFQTGSRQQYGISGSGGNDQTTFFLSGDFQREKGVYRPNDLRSVSLRGNIRHQASRSLDINVSTGYVSSDLSLPQNDNNSAGIVSSGLLGCAALACPDTSKHGYLFLTPEQAFNIDVQQSVERFTGSVTATLRPSSFLTFRAVVGNDVTNRWDQQTIRPGIVPLNQNTLDGNRISNRTQIFSYTANVSGTASFLPTPDLTSSTTVGVQYFKSVFAQSLASGRKLAQGSSSLNGVVNPTVGEAIDEFVTLGGYAEEQVGYHGRLFFTAALRGDDNSAFGKDFNFITYPKVSASWVISEEPFFPQVSFLNSLRLRMAYGRSGRQPGPNDAIQSFAPVAIAGATDVPGITVNNLGNDSLKPERTREIEAGFDVDVWQRRVLLEFTYYDKNSRDALIARTLAPSLGSSNTQFVNLGQVSNKGVEIQLTAQVIDRPLVSWSVTAGAWGNRNRLIDLGKDPSTGQKIPPIVFGLGGASQRHEEGYTLGSYWMVPYTYADANGDGVIAIDEVQKGTAEVFLGTPLPTHGGTLSSEVRFLKHFRLYGLLDGRFGNKLLNDTEEFRCEFLTCRGLNDSTASLADQARGVAVITSPITEFGFVEDASFIKLRELSLTYVAPDRWARKLGAAGLSFSVTGRNLATWTKYTGVDPELNEAGQANFTTADFLTQPPVRYFIARINITF